MTLKITFLTLLLASLAVADAKDPTIDTRAKAEESFDGLLPVRHSNFARAWVAADMDLSGYTKIMPGKPTFQFRAAREPSGTAIGRSTRAQKDFPLSDDTKQKLIDIAGETFSEELAKSERFKMTDQAGPDVLLVRGGMLDIVSHVPPDQMGRNEIYLSSVGEITLVLEIIDSTSGEVLGRAADRRALNTSAGTARSSVVTNTSQFRRVARGWASRFREGLDNFPNTIQ